ncbi:MAG: sporulation transcriptional regulator SpoIIID [Oscillospiraceae bacterium]|nr:sporulation transcriptional regulator SpoIIID [Oscillospiraceae bacterium]
MHRDMEQRACELAVYMIENRATVRAAARQFGVSKSTVHTVVTDWTASPCFDSARSEAGSGFPASPLLYSDPGMRMSVPFCSSASPPLHCMPHSSVSSTH